MVKQTQTIRRQIAGELFACVWPFCEIGAQRVKTHLTESNYFLQFWCIPCTATPEIPSSNKNINIVARVSKLSFRFLWIWCNFLYYQTTPFKRQNLGGEICHSIASFAAHGRKTVVKNSWMWAWARFPSYYCNLAFFSKQFSEKISMSYEIQK